MRKRLTGGVLLILLASLLTAVGEVAPRVAQEENLAVRDKTGKTVFKALYAPTPDYPLKARLHHEGGEGIFIMMLRRNGTVSAVAVARSTGMKDLDLAAAGALIQWRFPPPPPHIKGIRVPINFKMRSRITGGTILD